MCVYMCVYMCVWDSLALASCLGSSVLDDHVVSRLCGVVISEHLQTLAQKRLILGIQYRRIPGCGGKRAGLAVPAS